MASLGQVAPASENGHVSNASIKARIPQHVVYRTLASETVMLNLETGRYYGLNQTAGRMLELIERGTEFDAAVAQLASEFEAPEEMVREDFLVLCHELSGKGLIELEVVPVADGE
jgi:hypothetical protein